MNFNIPPCMKNCLYLLFSVCLFVSCIHHETRSTSAEEDEWLLPGRITSLIPDTAGYVVLMNCRAHYFDTTIYSDYYLMPEDLKLIDSLWSDVTTKYNKAAINGTTSNYKDSLRRRTVKECDLQTTVHRGCQS